MSRELVARTVLFSKLSRRRSLDSAKVEPVALSSLGFASETLKLTLDEWETQLPPYYSSSDLVRARKTPCEPAVALQKENGETKPSRRNARLIFPSVHFITHALHLQFGSKCVFEKLDVNRPTVLPRTAQRRFGSIYIGNPAKPLSPRLGKIDEEKVNAHGPFFFSCHSRRAVI